jgi:YfiH family protein
MVQSHVQVSEAGGQPLKSEFQLHNDTVPIIIPQIFSKCFGITAGMSMRHTDISGDRYGFNLSLNVGDDPDRVGKNREWLFSKMNTQERCVAYAEQCHSSVCSFVSEPGIYPKCDALITDKKNLVLSVSIADCVPILLFDPEKRIISAVHAGWRGTAKRIVMASVALMKEKFHVHPENIMAYIGPAAGSCCYEVGDEVSVMFRNKIVSSNGKSKIDLKSENKSQLRTSGLLENNIEMSPLCTVCSEGRLHSFRRDGNASGRMLAVIAMTS